MGSKLTAESSWPVFCLPLSLHRCSSPSCLSSLYHMSSMTMLFHASVVLCIPGLLSDSPLIWLLSLVFSSFYPYSTHPTKCWGNTSVFWFCTLIFFMILGRLPPWTLFCPFDCKDLARLRLNTWKLHSTISGHLHRPFLTLCFTNSHLWSYT